MPDIPAPYQPIPVSLRDDLQIKVQTYRDEEYWVVGDPCSLEYFRFNDQEYALLSWFNGLNSMEDIKQKFEQRFAPYQIEYREIQGFLTDAHEKSLVVSQRPGQGQHLYEIGKKKKFQKLLGKLKSVLAMRFKGINPDRMLSGMLPYVSWLFSIPALVGACLLWLSALGLLATHYEEFAAKLPSMQQFFSGKNLVLLGCALTVSKVLHELGHGLTLKKFGGECYELGVIMLLFIPTLYVDTSASWKLSSKWQRAAIGAGGVYIELILASLATFGWWYSNPGFFQYFCLNLMVLCSISSVVFNGNPLLKFDAYYVLSDLIEIPNLKQRSGQLIKNYFVNYGMGLEESEEMFSPWQTKCWLASYALASFGYKFLLSYSIAFYLTSASASVGLQQPARFLVAFMLSMLLLSPIIGLGKFLKTPGKLDKVKKKPLLITGAVLSSAFAFAALVPLPDSVQATFTVEPRNVAYVYVEEPSVLEEVCVELGQVVEKGQVIARLRSLELEIQLSETQAKLSELERRHKILKLTNLVDPDKSAEAFPLAAEMHALSREVQLLESRLERLVVRAPEDGVVIPEWKPRSTTGDDALELVGWDGSVMAAKNIKNTFVAGQVLCRVAGSKGFDAKIIVAQNDVELVRKEQPVSLLLNSRSDHSISTKVEFVSKQNSDSIDRSLLMEHGGTIEGKAPQLEHEGGVVDVGSQRGESSRPIYLAIAKLPDEYDDHLVTGLQGTAQIQVDRRPLLSKFVRFVYKMFRFDL